MPATLVPVVPVPVRRQIWIDILVGGTVLLWGVGIITAVLTRQWHSQVLASGLLLGAAVLSSVTVQIVTAHCNRAAAERSHREMVEYMAAVAAQVEQLGTTVGDGKWVGWAEALSDGQGEDRVIPFPVRNGSSRHN